MGTVFFQWTKELYTDFITSLLLLNTGKMTLNDSEIAGISFN